ncbi:hypothetical protein [Shewanella sp. Isolate11]|uniref:hypothetical protein n=1 Tax=Shewanella sp. Isolate11 TaxID=2908530 RepID=UPI001EFEA9EA|nr:hypothetical protein [Shewanella sp. Isolate11]MCG9698167.1 hypothetical protein [Shewanella sp. Isolate11]
MKGWIIVAAGVAVLYYFATQTDKLDEPIAQTDALLKKIERKLDSMTGTRIIRVEHDISHLKSEIADRLDRKELAALDGILETKESVLEFKDQYCGDDSKRFTALSKENQTFICDKIH